MSSTIANRPPLKRIANAARRAGRFVGEIGEIAEKSLTIRAQAELGEEIEIAFRPGLADREPDRYLDFALALPQRIAQTDGKSVVVFFDEFQEIANPRKPYGDPDDLTKRMRAIFQRSSEVSFLFAASIAHLLRGLFAPSGSAFSQFGAFYELRPISLEAWHEGLAERFAEDGCTIDDAALDRIVEFGDRHPRATMLVAQKTHLTSIILETRAIDTSVVQQGYEAALEGDRLVNEQSVEQIRRLAKLALLIVRRIAAGDSPHAGLNSSESYRAIRALHDAGFIEQPSPRRWKLTNPLLARYLTERDGAL